MLHFQMYRFLQTQRDTKRLILSGLTVLALQSCSLMDTDDKAEKEYRCKPIVDGRLKRINYNDEIINKEIREITKLSRRAYGRNDDSSENQTIEDHRKG